jgi:hypothetical protein
MSGGRCGFASFGVLLLSVLVACGGEREGAPGGAARDTMGSVNPETSVAGAVRSDTTTAPANPDSAGRGAGRPDTASSAAKPPASAPVKPPAPRKPAEPKPPAPKKPASTMEAPDTGTAAAPSENPAPAPAPADAPLRDAYHSAPLDTVTQVVYDGWKQFNLNCARCHGEDVQGTTIAPHLIVSLRPDGSIPTKELFMQTVCAGRPERGMPSWCALGMEMGKIEAIYSYVKGRSEGKLHQGRPALRQ